MFKTSFRQFSSVLRSSLCEEVLLRSEWECAAIWTLQKSNNDEEACVTFIQIHKGGRTGYSAGSPFLMHFSP